MSSNLGRAPAVFTSEIDLTPVTQAVSTSEGAIAGVYSWGPVEQRILVTNEGAYASQFGPPTNFNAETWFAGANFLAYSNALYVTRAANTAGSNTDILNTVTSAVASPTPVSNNVLLDSIVKNSDAYVDGSYDGVVAYIAKYPGELGNSLEISTCASPEAFSSSINLIANTDIDANTAVVFEPGSNVAVITILPSASGTPNTALEVANTVVQNLTIGDTLTFGNSQNATVVNIGTPTLVGNTVTLNVGLSSAVALFEPIKANTLNRSWEFSNLVDTAPGTSLYQATTSASDVIDEMHIVVVDRGGKFTGIPGSILEVFGGVSRATNAKRDNGSSNYFKNVLNQTSRYVWVGSGVSGVVVDEAENLTNISQSKASTLRFIQGQNGQDEASVPVSTLAKAWDKYISADDVSVSYLIQGKTRGNVLANYIKDNIAQKRGDCIAMLSPDQADVVNVPGREAENLVAYRRTLGSSSYAFLDGNFKYQYDTYNDVFRWIPLCGDIAGLAAKSSVDTAPWVSPGGYSRGRIKNVVKLAWSPDQAQRDVIYREDINPIYNVISQGPVVMGDKTLMGKNSAFSRINVRQLFNLLRKNIAAAAATLLFEINDDFTRSQFKSMNEPLLRDIQGRRGITRYLITCDETNNTPSVIDNNGFVGDIYITPARSINTIQLGFVATRTGVDFSEVIL